MKALCWHGIALLIIDMISDFEFEDGERLLHGDRIFASSCTAACMTVLPVNQSLTCWPDA